MKRLTSNLESIAEQICETFSGVDEAREKALPLCRDVIRHCSRSIRALHRQEFDQASELLQAAGKCLCSAREAVLPYRELTSTSFVRDAQKEFAEASITLSLVTGNALPGPDELQVDPAPYLNGLGEAAGELRRYLLDNIRQGDLSQGEDLLSAMDDIYGILVTIDFPDAITGGLRRTTDMVRGVLERTRSDLTLVMSQKDLEKKLTKSNLET